MVKKTPMMIRVEKRLGRPLEEVILEKYAELGSLEAVGKELEINPNTLYVWLLRMGATTKRVILINIGDNGSEEVSNVD